MQKTSFVHYAYAGFCDAVVDSAPDYTSVNRLILFFSVRSRCVRCRVYWKCSSLTHVCSPTGHMVSPRVVTPCRFTRQFRHAAFASGTPPMRLDGICGSKRAFAGLFYAMINSCIFRVLCHPLCSQSRARNSDV